MVAKKYAYLLGYNYQSSEWYEKSYKIFNKNYVNLEKKLKKEKNKKGLIDRVKSKILNENLRFNQKRIQQKNKNNKKT